MKVLGSVFIIGILFFTFTACRKDKTPEPEDDWFTCTYGENFSIIYDTTKKTEGLIPLSFYNYWVYADTIWTADGTMVSTSIDTAWSGNLRKTNSDLWWSIVGPTPIKTVHYGENKLYTLERGFTGCIYKSMRYYEATADTTHDGIGMHGDIAISRKVYKSGSIISTPAGDFEDCSVLDLDYYTTYQILKPGVGFVKFANGDYNGGYREYTLISYHLE
ncbi:MAG: hypothetical protein JKY22_12450 [Flavobacteriaceae bacterium]|nr:hypothetical protein [Flavobacteriaceae bacterium]